jgi:glyoxylase-like metal-dependent hydrolase (beta-lactamase superfamily II)
MEIISLPTVGFASNCYIVHNGKDAFVVDPSISEKKIIKNLEERGLILKGILLTHGHFDHIFHAQELREESGAPLYVHELDDEMLTDANKNAYRTFTGNDFTIKKADFLLHDGDVLPLGDEKITVLHTPGHTKGCTVYKCGDTLFTGDTLFAGTCGRCDVWSSDVSKMRESLERLCTIPENFNVLAGHGPATTLDRERKSYKLFI